MRRAFLSTDDNPMFIQFWPLVASAWARWGIRPTLALVTDRPREQWKWMEEYGDVVQYRTRSDVPAPNWAKVARWHNYYAWLDDPGIVSCIDMIPLNREYFESLFVACHRGVIVAASSDAYRPDVRGALKKVPGCYLLGHGTTWLEVVNQGCRMGYDQWVDEHRQIRRFDKKEALEVHQSQFSEESLMRVLLHDWGRRGGVIRMGERPGGWGDKIRRIDRAFWGWDDELLSAGYYLDCHSLRPLSSHADPVKQLVKAIGMDPALVDEGIRRCAS